MILGEKITLLRKQSGWSQEELAEKLEVSRQAVSKWESGASIPDLDKVIKISGVFEVSTDYLLKDEMEEVVYADGREVNTEDEGRRVSLEEANHYMEIAKKSSVKLALSVAACILSPICLLLLHGMADAGYAGITVSMAGGVGVALILLIVAGAVAVLIINGMTLSKYDYLEQEKISLEYGVYGIVEKRKADFEDTYRKCIVIGVMLCILGVIPIMLASAIEASVMVYMACTSLLLTMIACAVYLFIWSGTIRGSFTKLLQEEEYTVEEKAENKKIGGVSGAYWCIVVAIYLGISLWSGNWNTTWIIWPVAGVLFAAFVSIMKAVMRKNA